MSDTGLHINEFLIPGTPQQVASWYASLPMRAQEQFELFENEVVVVDTETTGFDPVGDALIEIAACILQGPNIIQRFQTFVNPGKPIPPEITELTGITNGMVANAPDPSLAVELFAQFAGDRNLVAHNAQFDRSFIMRQATPGDFGGDWLDSLAMSRIVLSRFRTHRLTDLCHAFDLHASSHRATDDTEATAQLWRILLAGAYSMPAGLANQIASFSPLTDWPLRSIFSQAALSMPSADFSLRICRSELTRTVLRPPREDAENMPLSFPSPAELEHAFSAEGTAGAMYEGYEQRNEQLDMALEVNEAFATGTHRALEAGTGVGKSMAYLLPGALAAKANGITLGVATKTNALMDQLVYNELPRLDNALGGLSYVALKGYEHYPCLRKMEALARDSQDSKPEVVEMLAMLYSYTSQTPWGDLDALNLHWGGLPRYAIEAASADCLKKRCPFFPMRCYLHGARRHAKGADVVVTNHALLFRDVEADNGILPPVRHWVIDEAHAVEDEARKQLSCSIGARDLEVTLQRLCGTRSGTIAQIRRKATEVEGGSTLFGACADIDERAAQTLAVSGGFFTFVKDMGAQFAERNNNYDKVTIWIGPQVRDSSSWQLLVTPGMGLVRKLEGLIARLRDLVSMTEQFEELAALQADLANGTCSLEEMRDALSLVLDGSNPSFVYSATVDRGTEKPAEVLSAERLDIGEALACDFYPNTMSVVYTSATLATGNASSPFGYFFQASGLDKLPPEKYAARQLASSYDFDANMRVLLPAAFPEPASRDYRGQLANLLLEVHRAMGGSVLTLFTNRREMEDLYQQLKPQLQEEGIELIAQTRGTSTKSLRDRFLADEQLSLFALRSFWEGFDAPGDTLRCVVIPKLPFGRPTDPLSRERELREGRNAWSRYSLPEAVMDLKQAAGRLIRNSTDSGYLVLADGRLQTKGYGRVFLRALPTTNIRTVPLEDMCSIMRQDR